MDEMSLYKLFFFKHNILLQGTNIGDAIDDALHEDICVGPGRVAG